MATPPRTWTYEGVRGPNHPTSFQRSMPFGTPVPFTRWLDTYCLAVALGISVLGTYPGSVLSNMEGYFSLRISVRNMLLVVIMLALWRVALLAVGVYRESAVIGTLVRITAAYLICLPLLLVVFLARTTATGLFYPLLIFYVASTLLMMGFRFASVLSAPYVRSLTRTARQVIIVGTGELASSLVHDLEQHPTETYEVLGFIDDEPIATAKQAQGPYLGRIESLNTLLMRMPVDDVFIALPVKSHYDDVARVMEICERAGVQSQYKMDIFPTTGVAKTHEPDGNRVIVRMVHTDSRLNVKRAIDLVGATLCLILFSPVFLLTALAIRFTSKGPVFFRQKRFGYGRRSFAMWKFRSMVVDAEKMQAQLEGMNESSGPVFKIKNDPRITRVGAFIRRTSIDELPQLFNVLTGEMSMVGPRPLPMRDIENFSELAMMRRFSVKPGMTGQWQVSGRSNLDFSDWMSHDLDYIDNWSLRKDLWILAMTIPAVFKGRGAS